MGLSQPDELLKKTKHEGAGAGEGEVSWRPPLASISPAQPAADGARSSGRQRRPDRAVYVPRARRSTDAAKDRRPSPPSPPSHTLPQPNFPQLHSPEQNLKQLRSPQQSSPQLHSPQQSLPQPHLPHLPLSPTRSQPHTPRKSLDRNYCNIYRPPHLRRHLDGCGDQANEETVPSQTAPSAVDYSYPHQINVDDKSHDPSELFDRLEKRDLSKESTYLEDSVRYNEINTNFYSNDANMADLSEINPSVPDPNIVNDVDQIIASDMYDKDEDLEQKELRRASREINRSNRRIMKQTFDSDVLVISDPIAAEAVPKEEWKTEEPIEDDQPPPQKPKLEAKVSVKREESDWESVFDDDGECLDPTLIEELTATVGKVEIARPKHDYSAFAEKTLGELSGEAFGHVVEVYGFPSEFKTNDLLSLFSDYKDTGFEIKWVDDTHALIVFSSAKIAAEVMSTPHPLVRCRPLRDAAPESKNKAKRCAEFLQPYRQRPETCTALARRLVSGALGVRLSTAHQERVEEKRLISIAKEKKRAAAKHREAAWDGSLADNT